MNEIEAVLILTHAPFLGPVKIRQLIEQCGSAEKALLSIVNQEPLAINLRKESQQYLLNYEKESSWKEDLLCANCSNTQLIPFTSDEFPSKLKTLSDCPPLLYVQGKLSNDLPSIAIIGTRASSFYGNNMAATFAEFFSKNGIVVISGLARGIDTHAHIGALKSGSTSSLTWGLIGSGLNCLYPEENKKLAATIAKHGAVISEYPMNTAPTKFTFPRRNRLVAALSDAIVLIEAPQKSGAMITMELGRAQKKALFAISNRAQSDSFQGNHFLIKQGFARLVDDPNEIIQELGWNQKNIQLAPSSANSTSTRETFFSFDEKKIIDLLKAKEASLDDLSGQISLSTTTLQVTLMRLVLRKIILELPGKRYTLVQ